MALGLSLAAGFRNASNWVYFKYIWVIIVGPFLGAALAALYFSKLFRPFVVRWR
jgi:glycerol uptake facilitator-like aquaporin